VSTTKNQYPTSNNQQPKAKRPNTQYPTSNNQQPKAKRPNNQHPTPNTQLLIEDKRSNSAKIA
jgi:hypothetical protein